MYPQESRRPNPSQAMPTSLVTFSSANSWVLYLHHNLGAAAQWHSHMRRQLACPIADVGFHITCPLPSKHVLGSR